MALPSHDHDHVLRLIIAISLIGSAEMMMSISPSCCSTDLTLAKRSKSAYHSAASGVLTKGGCERFQKTYGPPPWLRAPYSCLAGESSTPGDGLVQQVPALYRPRIYHCADSRSHRVPFRSGPDICKPFSHHAPCGPFFSWLKYLSAPQPRRSTGGDK